MEKPKSLDSLSLSDASDNRRLLWDCGSSLYDSFELTSFQHHLHSALAAAPPSRTFSMPHLSHRTRPFPDPNPAPSSKIARALQRLLKCVFRRRGQIKNNLGNATDFVRDRAIAAKDAGFYYVFYDKSGALSAIPEGAECDGTDTTTPLVRKTASERYTAKAEFGGYETTPLVRKTASDRYTPKTEFGGYETAPLVRKTASDRYTPKTAFGGYETASVPEKYGAVATSFGVFCT